MQLIVVAVDGSKPAERAVKHVIALHTSGMALQVLLLNVQPEWAPPRSRDEKREGVRLHLAAGERATRSAKSLLALAGVPFKSALRVGPAAEHILKLAREKRCDQIVMGSRGRGALAGLVLGSVAMKVLQLAGVPVTVVR
jgi:nucleotide-binding universal stress UspA family protein